MKYIEIDGHKVNVKDCDNCPVFAKKAFDEYYCHGVVTCKHPCRKKDISPQEEWDEDCFGPDGESIYDDRAYEKALDRLFSHCPLKQKEK